jgi:2-oxoisovalerate dehydrogenase E1 component alpha subunit
VNSKFTNSFSFHDPAKQEAMATYRVMDSEGNIVDPTWKPDFTIEEAVKMYKDMLSGKKH